MSLLLIWQQQTGPVVNPCFALADTQFKLDSLNFFIAYDLLGTETERAALQRLFLLQHGGRMIKRNGILRLIGGEYPVRWCL